MSMMTSKPALLGQLFHDVGHMAAGTPQDVLTLIIDVALHVFAQALQLFLFGGELSAHGSFAVGRKIRTVQLGLEILQIAL